mmetsp:Transcript_14906/g.37179  ORF Transcript_14906/g.37179 Transcript_14906/m.37179 type:complete len:264 (-) Transcript_14906:147-938(-)
MTTNIKFSKRSPLVHRTPRHGSEGPGTRAFHQPASPPTTTSLTAMFSLMTYGTTEAVMGNSTGDVLTTRTTLPDPMVSKKHKKGRSSPSSVYNSITCLLLFGPWRSSILALRGRPSVFRSTCTLSTRGSKAYVRSAPPCTTFDEARHSSVGCPTLSAETVAAKGNSSCPMLRMAIVLGPRGVSITQLKGRSSPFSQYTRILQGVLSGPCQSSTSASSGRPSVRRTTCTCSTAGERYVQVRSDPPCTRMVLSKPRPLVGSTRPE